MHTIVEKSVIIAAHPDDEVLWFSSIVDRVDRVVVCFLDYEPEPHWGPGRRRSLLSHPVRNISSLGLKEAGVFDTADWREPTLTEFGIEIPDRSISKRYSDNYRSLKQLLSESVRACCNVVTHNPWGEYGHEEHVQVYRVVKELQSEMGFNLWFSNYCSNRSFRLMLRYVSGFDAPYITLRTNKDIAMQAKELYKENGCWTWFDDWEWFNEESFMLQRDQVGVLRPHGRIFPINMIKFRYSEAEHRRERPVLSIRGLRMLKGRIRRRMAMRST
ncbi:MAG: hypothetical protein AB1553_07950 [Nitrospirota bacterium]